MKLTELDKTILTHVAEGWCYKQLGPYLGYTEQSIKNLISQIRRKMNAHTTAQAVAIYIRTQKEGTLCLSE